VENYPDDLDLLDLAEGELGRTANACFTLHQYGCADDITEDANSDM